MKCVNCSNEIPDGSGFCPFCGAPQPVPQQQPQQYYAPAYPPVRQKKRIADKPGLIALIVVIAVLAVFAATALGILFGTGVIGGKGKSEEHPSVDTRVDPDTGSLPPVTEPSVTPPETGPSDTEPADTVPVTETPADESRFAEPRIYVFKADWMASDDFCSCVEFFPDGSFIFTENLLSGMGKMLGTYERVNGSILLNVTRSYDSGYAGSDVGTLEFTENENSIVIRNAICSTSPNDVFLRNDSYVPSSEFYEADFEPDYPPEATRIYDMPETRSVNVGYSPSGTPYYLFLRTSPTVNDASNRICMIPHGAEVTVLAEDASGEWAWIYYNGPAHSLAGDEISVEVNAWCANVQKGEIYLVG